MPLAERLERTPVTVLRPFHQNWIAEPRIDERPFRPEGLLDSTRLAARKLHRIPD
jgi:hypothetical protein